MKGKKNIFLLLSAAAIVWGIIIFKIISAFFYSPNNSTNTSEMPIDSIPSTQSDSLVLFLNYRDPFLGASSQMPNPMTTTKLLPSPDDKPISFSTQPEKNDWPSISYHGIIISKSSNRSVAIFKISGKEISLSENQQASGITLISADKTSAKVKFNNEIRSIKK